MANLSTDMLNELLALGASDVARITPTLAQHPPGLDDSAWQFWARSASDESLRRMMRGLVLYSRATDSPAGSASPLIPLYWEFVSRAPRDEPEVTAWIVDNRTNEYEPFGTGKHGGARTLEQFRTYQHEDAARAAEGVARDKERQRRAANDKARTATAKLPAAVKRGDLKAVQALIQAGADLNCTGASGQSLMLLARAAGRQDMVELLSALGLEGALPPDVSTTS